MKPSPIFAIVLLVLSLFSPPSRFLFYVRLALIAVLVLVASGCAPAAPKQLIKPTQVEVTKYVRAPIPDELIQDRTVIEPPPKCTLAGKPVFCNGQTAITLQDYRDTLKQSNADKAALRALNAAQLNTPPTDQGQPGAGEPAPVPAEGHRP
jgi:hypothetical protein